MSIYLTEQIINEVYFPLIRKAQEAAYDKDDRRFIFNLDKFHESLIQLTIAEVVKVMEAIKIEADQECRYLGDDVPTIVHMNEIEKHFGLQ